MGRPVKKRRGPHPQSTTASQNDNYPEVKDIGKLLLSDDFVKNCN